MWQFFTHLGFRNLTLEISVFINHLVPDAPYGVKRLGKIFARALVSLIKKYLK